MKRLVLIPLLLFAAFFASAQTKPDFIRTPNGPNTIVDWNVKFKTMILPHYNKAHPPTFQDTVGAVFMNTDTTDKHVYFRYKMGAGGIIAIANLSDITTGSFINNSATFQDGAKFNVKYGRADSTLVIGHLTDTTRRSFNVERLVDGAGVTSKLSSTLFPGVIISADNGTDPVAGVGVILGQGNPFYTPDNGTHNYEVFSTYRLPHVRDTVITSCTGCTFNTSTGALNVSAGTTTNAITFNNSGSGASSGAAFDGSAAKTISYNTIGAYPLSGNPSGFLTANQSISFAPTGDVTGTTSGTTSLAPALTIGDGKVTNAMLAGSIDLTTKVTGVLPNANTTGSTTATASTLALRDANINISANRFLSSGQTITSSGATTTLTVASPFVTAITGASTQTIQMPVVATLATYDSFLILNNSSSNIFIVSSGGNAIQTVVSNSSLLIQYNGTSGTSASSWTSVSYSGAGALGSYLPLTLTGNSTINAGSYQLNLNSAGGNDRFLNINGATLSINESGGTSIAIGRNAAGSGNYPNSVVIGHNTGAGYSGGTGYNVLIGNNTANRFSGGAYLTLLGPEIGDSTATLALNHAVLLGYKTNPLNTNLTNILAAGDQAKVPYSNMAVIGNSSMLYSWIYGGLTVKTLPVAINSTATATAAQFAQGYITSTSASATTITTPTATALASYLYAGRGTTEYVTIDNTAGANTVTLSLDPSFTLLNSGSLTVPSGATGIGTFKITLVSTTAATISRIE